MNRKLFSFVTMLTLALVAAASLLAQEQPAASQAAAPKAEKPARHAHAEAAKAETISGTLSTVDADKKLVVVTASSGIPYDFEVNSATKITVGGNKAKLVDLSSDANKQASVTFLSMKKRGNIAKSIEISE